MKILAARNTVQVLDLLCARLAFERAGVQLYDGAIMKIERHGEPRYQALVDTLRENRDEEQEHADWLVEQIRSLGGHPDEQTDMSRLEMEESQGIKSVILDGHSKTIHILHALLAAELADNAGWDVLVAVARDAGDRMAELAFQKRLLEEAKHLLFLREAIQRAADVEILGIERKMPSRPSVALARQLGKPLALGLLGVGLGGAIGAGLAMTFSR